MPKILVKDKERPIDVLRPSDYQIIELARQDANKFTEFYLRSATSGTYWQKDYPDAPRVQTWRMMRDTWARAGQPVVFPFASIDYKVSLDHDGDPVFFDNHGPMFQDWQLLMHHAPQFETLTVGGVGTGKEQPLDAKILTPTGWSLMGDIEVGDRVIGSDGKGHAVLGVFPQGEKDIYRVTFSDGSSTECGLDHLWTVQENNRPQWKTVPLEYIIEKGLEGPNGSPRFLIQSVEPVEYDETEPLPMEPYAMGAFIGRVDDEFIPSAYKYASIDDRLAILQGLFDTAGCAGETGVEYFTSSERLAADVSEIVRSLGGYVSVASRVPGSCRLRVRLPVKMAPFRLKHKAEHIRDKAKCAVLRRSVKSISLVGQKQAQCILVDAEDHLYVTDDFIVTHNTKGLAMSMLTHAATVPDFEGMVLAWTLDQAKQTWEFIKDMLEGTAYQKRWVWKVKESPHPEMIIKNNYVGESKIRVRSIQDHNMRSILTYELDALYVDQTEAFLELNELRKAAGTRLRGRTEKGRPRLSKVVYIANSAENEEMWYMAELARQSPEKILFLNPWTEHNPFLTSRDIENIRGLFKTREEAEVWMHGARPIGGGAIFTSQIVTLCADDSLTKMIEKANAEQWPGWIVKDEGGLGLYHYEIPPEAGRIYVVVADPGSADPPARNSACIMTLDVTEFPSKPAVLIGFNWVFGNGNYQTFIAEYMRTVIKYHAQTRNGFDSTGLQTLFDQLVFSDQSLQAEGINLNATGKYAAINAARYFMGKGMIQFPRIPHLLTQMARYRLPEPEKLPQDLIMTICMGAWYIHRFFWEDPDDKNRLSEEVLRVANRYERRTFDRCRRHSAR